MVRTSIAQPNMLARKFSWCAAIVKYSLFNAFYNLLFTTHLWLCHKKSILHRLSMAYDSMRLFLKTPIICNASQMFPYDCAPTCSAVNFI